MLPSEEHRPGATLTGRERRVVDALAAGSSNRTIARQLGISVKTVEFHLGNVFRKFGVGSRVELLAAIAASAERAKVDGSLPARVPPMIGRDDLLWRVAELLQTAPLVTLTGVGGVGKTRLAIGIGSLLADRFVDGAWMVELATLTDEDHVATACVDAFALHSRSARPAASEIAAAIGRQRRLLILDNCEHLLDAAAAIAEEIVACCPNTVVLATSRERLAIAREHVVIVPPVSLERAGGLSPAERIFADRAAAATGMTAPGGADQDLVLQLCERLDGLPLAIELAAARTGGLDVSEILERLDDRDDVLSRRSPRQARHRSVTATVDWSYRMLSESERQMFESLSVFRGDFDTFAAASVDAAVDELDVDDVLSQLVEKSLLGAKESGGGRRFVMLDSVRRLADRHLDRRGDTRLVRQRHVAHYVHELHHLNAGIRGSDEVAAHAAILTEWHNVRLAMSNACASDDAVSAGQLLVDVLWWASTRMRVEVGGWCERLLALPAADGLPTRVVAVCGAAYFAHARGDAPRTRELIAQARQLEESGRFAEPWVPAVEVFLANDDAIDVTLETQQRALETGSRFWEVVGALQESVFRAWLLAHWPDVQADPAPHLVRVERALTLARELGNPNGIAYGLRNMGEALTSTDPARAERLLREALDIAVPLGLELLAGEARHGLAHILTQQGRPRDALVTMAPALISRSSSGAWRHLSDDLAVCIPALKALGLRELADRVGDAWANIRATGGGGGGLDVARVVVDTTQRMVASSASGQP